MKLVSNPWFAAVLFDFVRRFFAFILSRVARYTPSSSSENHSNKYQKSLAANFCELLTKHDEKYLLDSELLSQI